MGSAPEYHIQDSRGYSILTFDRCLGDCKWGDIERIGSEIRTTFTGREKPNCLIDLSRLEFMGSSIVALLIRIWKTLQEKNGSMVVVNPNSTSKEVLEIAGLSKVWTICASRDEAEALIRKSLPSHETGLLGILCVIVGWVLVGGSVLLLEGTVSASLQLPNNSLLSGIYGCAGIGGLSGLIAVIIAKGSWRALALMLLVAAIGLIATVATYGI